MKKLFFVLALSTALMACKNEKKEEPAPAPKVEKVVEAPKPLRDGVYQFSNRTSSLMWKGYKPTGSHDGTVALKEGTLQVKGGKLMGGKFMFDMTKIAVMDIPKEDENNAKLLGHLTSPDFFDVAKHPTSSFVIKEVKGDSIMGHMMIKEVKQPVTFKYTMSGDDRKLNFSVAPANVDRTKFNIKYKSKKFFKNLADKFINDMFEVSFKGDAMFLRSNFVVEKPAPKPERSTKYVYFSTGGSMLNNKSMMELNAITKMMPMYDINSIRIEGHTDSIGMDDFNQKLSEKRAMSAKNYLLKNKVPSTKVSTMGYGETKPMASNDNSEGRMKNRRSEIMIVMTKKS